MLLACAGGAAPSASERAAEAALDEAAALCSARVSSGPSEERALQRRVGIEIQRMAAGATSFDDSADELARIHSEASDDCFDQVLPALAGEGGAEALAILRTARLSCEAEGVPPASSALAQCIHARKLDLFLQRSPSDGPRQRETLDRLLRVGGGAPLPPELREEYCRTRELGGTGHPLCE
jgi:hypothetical protein